MMSFFLIVNDRRMKDRDLGYQNFFFGTYK